MRLGWASRESKESESLNTHRRMPDGQNTRLFAQNLLDCNTEPAVQASLLLCRVGVQCMFFRSGQLA